MYVIHQTILSSILIGLIVVFCFFPVSGIEYISSVVTILSIVFGFNITALATLFGRDLLVQLNKIIDEGTSRKQTQLHTLLAYFRYHAYSSLSILAISFVYQVIGKSYALMNAFIVASVITIIVLTGLLVRIFTSFLTKT